MGNSLLFISTQLANFQFPVYLEQREICLGSTRLFPIPRYLEQREIVLALVINIIFPVIYFYDDNPLFSTLKNTSVFCFHGAKCSQAKEKTAYESMQ